MKKMNKEARENFSKQLSKEAHGHYLDRMERLARALERPDMVSAIYSVRQLYTFFNCKPKCAEAVLFELSERMVWHCENLGFSKKQLNRLYYVIYSSLDLGLKPEKELVTDEARSNTN